MVRETLLANAKLRDLAVSGEVTNFSLQPNGTMYFELKEGGAFLKCVAWYEFALRFPPLQNGSKVIARGSIGVYDGKSSFYQLNVRSLELDGVGRIQQQFEERKQRLAAEGLFDRGRKRSLPTYPFAVALVSSRQAAGAQDFVRLLAGRSPHVRIVWCEASVQGSFAASQLAGALERASQIAVDVIVIARGGGSFEDLFVFSDERVVRAVARARHPVVSAVGHTIDQQLCDLAADLHVETPSAAAESIGRRTVDLRSGLQDQHKRLSDALVRRSNAGVEALRRAIGRTALTDPQRFFGPLRQRLDDRHGELVDVYSTGVRRRTDRAADLRLRLERGSPSLRLAKREERMKLAVTAFERAARTRFERFAHGLTAAAEPLAAVLVAAVARREHRRRLLETQLDGRNPETILRRGYAIVQYAGATVRDPAAVPLGVLVEARLARGTLTARVENKGPYAD